MASNIDSAWQWRLFSEEGGGLTPVFELIGDASRVLSESIRLPIVISSDLEEAFASATAACRALRDLCALSPELAAIIAEGVLDASEEAMRDNIGFQEKVIPSLVRMLKYTLEEDHKRSKFLCSDNVFSYIKIRFFSHSCLT